MIFAAAVKCSFVTVHAPALRPHRAPVTGIIAMSLHLHEVCLQQTEGRADAMRWAPTLSPPTPSVQLSHLVSFRLQSVPPLCFTSIPLPDYLPSHRQWIGGLHVEEDVAVPLPTNQCRATPTAVLPLSFPRCAVEAVVGNSGGHGRQHHGPVDRQPEDCKAVRMLAP